MLLPYLNFTSQTEYDVVANPINTRTAAYVKKKNTRDCDTNARVIG